MGPDELGHTPDEADGKGFGLKNREGRREEGRETGAPTSGKRLPVKGVSRLPVNYSEPLQLAVCTEGYHHSLEDSIHFVERARTH